MELLGVILGWLLSPFRDPMDEAGTNRYWEHPDFEAESNTTKESTNDRP